MAGKSVSKVSICSLDVVVKNYSIYKNFDNDTKVNNFLTQCCKEILMYSMLSAKSRINLSNNKLGKLYGIAYVTVPRIVIQNYALSGVVRKSTKIMIKSVKSMDYYKFSQEATNSHKLGGLHEETRRVLQLVHLNRMPNFPQKPLGVIINGPPGCGKTSLAKEIANESHAILLRVNPLDVMISELGGGVESLKKLFLRAIDLVEERPVILFFDEIDILCPRSESASMGNKQLANAFMAEMDELQRKNIAGLFVLATTNVISSIDPLLRRPGRFDHEVLINVPNQLQRSSILEVLTSDYQLASDVCCDYLAQRTPGFVGADLQQLCEEALNQAVSNQEDDVQNVLLNSSDFESALHKVIPSLKKSSECAADVQPVHWNDIGGLEEVKAELKQSVEWPLLFPEALRGMDISPTKGLLLYGPPGCCKTTLVRAAATSCHVSFLSLSGAQVYSPYVGESERIISEAFQKARALAPSILFFDELESLVGKRSSGSGQSRVQERILSTLLNEMDGVGTRLDTKMQQSTEFGSERQKTLIQETGSFNDKAKVENVEKSPKSTGVMLVGATNRPDMLDAAILRPGRLDRHIYVPPPNAEAREAILKIYTNRMSCQDNLNLNDLSLKTNFYTGADLKNLCKEAGLVAFRQQALQESSLDSIQVTQNHFVQALDTVKASLSEGMLEHYNANHKRI